MPAPGPMGPYLLLPCPGKHSVSWGPLWSWHGDSKAWQETFNLPETPGSIAKARDTAAGSARGEVPGEGVSRDTLGIAAKSRGQVRSQTPYIEQVVSCLVTSLQKITRLPPSPSACSQKANVSVAMPECLFWQRTGAWPAGTVGGGRDGDMVKRISCPVAAPTMPQQGCGVAGGHFSPDFRRHHIRSVVNTARPQGGHHAGPQRQLKPGGEQGPACGYH